MDTYEETLQKHIRKEIGCSSRHISHRSLLESTHFLTIFAVSMNNKELLYLEKLGILYFIKPLNGVSMYYIYINSIKQMPEVKNITNYLKTLNTTKHCIFYNKRNLRDNITIENIENIFVQ